MPRCRRWWLTIACSHPPCPGGFDVVEAARLELDWWPARREAVGPGQYGVTVARVAAVTYGKRADAPSLMVSGIGRAKAMGLSRRARAGDDGSGLVRDRVPVAARTGR
ncbi:hypothetical protein ACF1BQ_015600 [Bradyrhizobium sp. RDT10]